MRKVQTVAITVADRVAANNPDFTFYERFDAKKIESDSYGSGEDDNEQGIIWRQLYDSGDNNLLQDVGGIGTFRDVARA